MIQIFQEAPAVSLEKKSREKEGGQSVTSRGGKSKKSFSLGEKQKGKGVNESGETSREVGGRTVNGSTVGGVVDV